MTDELKPCPFCNGVCIAHERFHMTCVRCGADGPDADTDDLTSATSEWNRRDGERRTAPAGG